MENAWSSSVGGRALVTGATGTVGRALVAELGGNVVATTRSAARGLLAGVSDVVTWDGVSTLDPRTFENVDVVFHLAGEPVAEGRWTAEKKRRISQSRVEGTRALVRSLGAAAKRPRVLVSASAVGFYGSRGDEPLNEASAPGEGFLPDVCKAWEEEAARARDFGVRVVSLRIGIVLSTQGGALEKMVPLFRLGIAGRLGDGKQFMPWIHCDDVVGLLRFAAARDDVSGPVDAVSPELVTNAEFTRALAHALHRPAVLAAPAFALRLALGESAAVILASQRVTPRVALEKGYTYRYPRLADAFAKLFPSNVSAAEHKVAS